MKVWVLGILLVKPFVLAISHVVLAIPALLPRNLSARIILLQGLNILKLDQRISRTSYWRLSSNAKKTSRQVNDVDTHIVLTV